MWGFGRAVVGLGFRRETSCHSPSISFSSFLHNRIMHGRSISHELAEIILTVGASKLKSHNSGNELIVSKSFNACCY